MAQHEGLSGNGRSARREPTSPRRKDQIEPSSLIDGLDMEL